MLAGLTAQSHGENIELGGQTLAFGPAFPLWALDSCAINK